jgi:hypothetical protein
MGGITMARSRKLSSKSSTETPPILQGAAPYKPKMTKTEVLEEIRRVSGEPTRLADLRRILPVARVGKSAAQIAATAAGRLGRIDIAAGGEPDAEGHLTIEERLVLIDQAMLMLREVYAHLSLKRALHAIDPIQRLQLLRLRHAALDEREFHSELIDIFVSLRDLHTNYTLPNVYWSKFAFLPFRVEEYYVEQ